MYHADRGKITAGGGTSARDVIGVVHQDLGVIDTLTITENVRLGVPGGRAAGVFLRRGAERRAALAALVRVGLTADPDQLVGDMATAEKSLLAIARLLTRDKRVIVVDETTAALPAESASWLLARLRDLAADGAAIVVVSHRLGEIIEACDRLVVLVDGQLSLDRPVEGIDAAGIADAMSSGRMSSVTREQVSGVAGSDRGQPHLTLSGVSGRRIHGVDMALYPGEVLGVTGPVGSGLHELARIAAGVSRPVHGRRELSGPHRVAFLPPDRRREGLMLDQTIHWNATISSLHRYRHSRAQLLDLRRERRDVRAICERMGVKAQGIDQAIRELSGGNQQKVLIGRVLLEEPDVVVLCEPTLGVDVHTRAEIYDLIDEFKEAGTAILVASSDLEEVLAISDRLGVVRGDGLTLLEGSQTRDWSSLKELAM